RLNASRDRQTARDRRTARVHGDEAPELRREAVAVVSPQTAGIESAGRELAGRVAVVTGAARAIGRETAETLAARGAAIVSIDLADANATVDAITSRGGEAVSLVAD